MTVRLGWCLMAALVVGGLSLGPVNAEDKPREDIVAVAKSAGSFKTLVAALDAAGLVETLQGKGPFTVFAPTDEAFEKLPAGTVESLLKPENKGQLVAVLTYHVVPARVPASQVVKMDAAATVNGQQVNVRVEKDVVRVDKATVVKADIDCANGVIHVIDEVLLPSFDNLVVTAEKAGKFKTLLAAAKAAGLVETLSGSKPLTIFAPTDEAFKKLPAGTVEDLLKPENKEKLAAILAFHVVPGRVFAKEVVGSKGLKTVQGGMLVPSMQAGKAKINGAGIVSTDIDASNGVVHVIDTVMLPPQSAPGKKPVSSLHRPAPCRTTVVVVKSSCHR